MPLEDAAAILKRSLRIIKSQMRNGRIQRDRHFRNVGSGKFELNIPEYCLWLKEEANARKLPFLERVKRDIETGNRSVIETLERQAVAVNSNGKAASSENDLATPRKKPKLIPLSVWAEETFGEYAPSANTLRNWVKQAKIFPIPAKIGRKYFVSPDAEYVDAHLQKIRRMVSGR